MDHSPCKKVIDILILNFKGMFLAPAKVREKDFQMVLPRNSKIAVTELL